MVKESTKTTFSPNFSMMRVAAALAVILLHTCSTLGENRDIFAMSDPQAGILGAIVSLMRWAVPVFFMLTGALLLDSEKKITYQNEVFRYVRRIVLALLVFGIPFAMMKGYMENHGFSPALIGQSVIAVIENNSLSHLWYLYDLIGIYLVLPLIKSFIDKENDREIRIALIILGIFDFILPGVARITGLNIAFHIPLQYSLFYVMAGWYLRVHSADYPKILTGSLACMSALFAAMTSYKDTGSWFSAAYDSPLIAVYSLCIFCLFMQTEIQINEKNSSLLWNADRLCFAVYLVHPVFIQFTYRFLKITPLISEKLCWVLIPIFWILFAILSFTGAWVLRKIPVMKNYIL